jgi:hypothetical protein
MLPRMDRAAIWQKMAETWRDIARETSNPGLKECYVAKADRYRALAAEEHRDREDR